MTVSAQLIGVLIVTAVLIITIGSSAARWSSCEAVSVDDVLVDAGKPHVGAPWPPAARSGPPVNRCAGMIKHLGELALTVAAAQTGAPWLPPHRLSVLCAAVRNGRPVATAPRRAA